MADKEKNTSAPESQENTAESEKDNSQAAKEDRKSKKASKKEDAAAAEIKKLNEQISQLNDKYLRTLAEYDNFRKRSQREKEAIYADSKSDVITKLLPVLDNFDRAEANAEKDPEAYRKGVSMTLAQLRTELEKLGVVSFGEKGESFDPNFHNAVMHEEDEQYGDNEITDVFIRGYKLGERVLRTATVKVAN